MKKKKFLLKLFFLVLYIFINFSCSSNFEHTSEEEPINMIKSIGIIGDSYCTGTYFSEEKGDLEENEKYMWGNILHNLTNWEVVTYAAGGATTKNFLEWNKCMKKLLNDSPKKLYIICLGINDADYLKLGCFEDINKEAEMNLDTFYGNYGKILSKIKEHAPNAKFIICKTFIPNYKNGRYYNYSSKAIEELSIKLNIPFIETKESAFFMSDTYNLNICSGHPIRDDYEKIAKSMLELINITINKNKNYFNL